MTIQILLFLLPMLTFAQTKPEPPLPFEGRFVFSGQTEPRMRVTFEVINMRMPDAKQKLENAKNAGGNCWLRGPSTYRCETIKGRDQVAQKSLEEMAIKYSGLFADFENATRPAELFLNGDSVREWHFHQNVTTLFGTFSNYRFWERVGAFDHKLKLPDGEELVIFNQDRLYRFTTLTVVEREELWHQDVAYLVLDREKIP